jgi:hypothetical protein
MRRWMTVLIVLAAVSGFGCAGPAKLAENSESKLAEGDMWKAWQLATRALDKAPANPRARAAATAAASTISQDWQRRIVALEGADSTSAAEEVLKYAQFRTDAIPYTTVQVSDNWMQEETRLRRTAAQRHYADGVSALNSRRPKKAYGQFLEAERFVSGYRDAMVRANAALQEGLTRVAVVPLRSSTGNVQIGRDVAAAWSGALTEHLSTSDYFTRILPADDVEQLLRVSDLGRTSRADAIRLGQRAGADRVVWGSIGAIDSHSGLHFFQRNIWHLATVRDETGHAVSRWVEMPIQVVARTRTVNVGLAYEVISTRGGATLARESGPRTLEARAVWTAYLPDGGPDTYMLVTDEFRRANPERAKQIESEWASVVGAGVTLGQVCEARRACAKRPYDRNEVLARYAAGAAFVMLEDLPSAQELAQAALSAGWPSVQHSLVQLDDVDDVDLGAISAGDTSN